MLPYDKRLQKGFANRQTTRNLRFSWCFAVEKKAQKTFLPKLNWKTLANLNIQTIEFQLPNFSLNLDFGNFENETPNKRVKTMSEEELHTSVEDQKSINTSRSTQFALRTWQTWLFAEADKKPIEVHTKQELSRLLKHFYWEIRTAKRGEYEPSSLKAIQRGLDGIYR